MEYKFSEIEEKWKKIWNEKQIYKVTEDPSKPKYYVLDMFPYPSGAGLHVGHPLGYVASDIYARYKRLKGFNVLHPMGYDAFGLPAEQYAIETGTHPAVTTEKAIARYREQLDKIGFSFDWSRQVKTSDPDYYKWTQWIFLKLYSSWYNREKKKAEPIETLIEKITSPKSSPKERTLDLPSKEKWENFSEAERENFLMNYRLVYLSFAEVNWCEALGSVLANDEVKDGKSERGGYSVEKRRMRQWFLRITEYSDRLLDGLEKLDWSEAMKEMQRNWIGRSEGASVQFHLSQTLSEGEGLNSQQPRYYTTDGQTHKTSLANAKEMRKNPTEAEAVVWDRLKNKQTGFKFRRQHPVDRYIPDFVCLQKGLAVEIDGEIHLQQKEQDELRTEDLQQHGFTVLRFTNAEVIANIDNVIEKIKATLLTLKDRNSEDDAAVKVPSFGGDLGEVIEVFTTRPDTIFGATFLVLAPEHELVSSLVTSQQKEAIEKYISYVKSRSDVERQQEKKVTGEFTGAYAVNPFTGKNIPVYIAEYVLAGYGTGAIMAVPADDERDKKFAEKFGLPVVDVIDKSMYPNATIEDKAGKMINSDFLNGLEVKDAIKTIIDEIEKRGIGKRKVNYKQRDAIYSRQRYWGEPIPVKYHPTQTLPEGEGLNSQQPIKDAAVKVPPLEGFREVAVKVPSFGGDLGEVPVALNENDLPLKLPEVTSFKPTGDGRSPLANNKEWINAGYETDTMPGYAGSSWYFLRYMDPQNSNAFAAKDKLDYWQNVDIYFGGAEHAVGHLLYSRMWHKFLYDLGYVNTDEPFKKMVNQGMITGVTRLLTFSTIICAEYSKSNDGSWIKTGSSAFHLYGITDEFGHFNHPQIKVDKEGFFDFNDRRYKYEDLFDSVWTWRIPTGYFNEKEDRMSEQNFRDYLKDNPHILTAGTTEDDNIAWVVENGQRFIQLSTVVEKMSKSKYNVVNPDDVIAKYGADCFRMFEMFLGPIEQSKPWDDKGISGVSNFLKKFWRLFYPTQTLPFGEGLTAAPSVTDEEPTTEEYKVLHKTLKKIADDIERLNFNTCVSAFMIAANELTALNSHKKKILEPLLIALAPFAPFITEELWKKLGNSDSIHRASFPQWEEKYLIENTHTYAVSVNGKVRAEIVLPLDVTEDEARAQVLELDKIKQWTNGSAPKKFIFVKGKIINVVV